MILLKYLKIYRSKIDENIVILLDHQNNFVGLKLVVRMSKLFAALLIKLEFS